MSPWVTARSLARLVAAVGLSVFLCAAQSLIPGDTSAAKVVSLSGQVSVLKDLSPWALTVGEQVNLGQEIETGPDGFAVFEVTDGSTFEVYPNSHVTFRNNPGNWRDLLDVWIGRVKIHIQTWGGRPNRNRVTTPTAVISVRGTVFVVDVEDSDATTLVLVEEGQVAVQHALLPRSDPKLLNAGEWLRIFRNQPLASKSVDKGSVIRAAFRALSDALYTAVYRTPRVSTIPGGSIPTGGTGPLPGDPEPKAPPPPPGDIGGSSAPPPPGN